MKVRTFNSRIAGKRRLQPWLAAALLSVAATVPVPSAQARDLETSNFGRDSNPALDAVLTRTLTTLDATMRENLVRGAVEVAMTDVGLAPLHFQTALWGLKRGIAHAPRADGLTLAAAIRVR